MILRVLPDTHPRLRIVCKEVEFPLSLAARAHAQNLIETRHAHKALGIASNQTKVGATLRIIAVNLKEHKGAMFNPVIVERSSEKFAMEEGCLSSERLVAVKRSKFITVSFQNAAGDMKVLKLQDLSAVVIQHEIDHLDGKLISDYL